MTADITPTSTVPDLAPAPAASASQGSPSTWRAVLRALRRNKVAMAAAIILALVVLIGIFAPLIAPYDPSTQHLVDRLKPPIWLSGSSDGHLLGTDHLGRDVLSRVLYGTRVSLLVGLAATVLSGLIGTVIGIVCGYYRGWVDALFMRLADIQLAFPTILLALVVVVVLGPSLWVVIVVLGLSGWMSYARVIRAEVLSLRSRDFVTAARAIGDSDLQIMNRHLRPNVMAPLATIGTLQVAAMIVAEASLSYLGFGVPPSIPTWGGMLSEGQLYITNAWWLALFSGLAITLTTLSINVVGDMLRDFADPKAYR
ncbi:ABC transporter permease [Aeromicrobium chenweiae]|uniref:Peptide ABC transporter permease n=1 Tax=Aeromicrobium chenweiae TaxID=2079793 RepID=A0A2S0WHT6_9ACTN|nr:ABC transporter permease [Aeromicrobium chenweiae]AWB90852.1 peptide ABC transporter permease [Aeromicrobium chenweiae]TGN31115.1 ABC transporter permease [Aeromicrobium chenweiae]